MSDVGLRIVFMGTPDFAVPSLQVLVENDIQVVGVITAPDKPQGRGKKMGISAVKAYAESKSLQLLQPTNLKDPGFQQELADLKADLQIVVAFRMLPESVWSMPPLGTFNLHASLLPNYRGAAPIHWAIINGETKTGVTTFFLKQEIDTGSIIFQEEEAISNDDNVGEVYQRLMHKGALLVLKTVKAIAEKNYSPQEQIENNTLRRAPKIFKEDCQIDWNQTAEQIRNKVRGLSPFPAAWTYLHDKTLKIFSCDTLDKNLTTGQFYTDGKTYLWVGAGDKSLNLTDVQLEGKKRMKVDELLRGYRWADS